MTHLEPPSWALEYVYAPPNGLVANCYIQTYKAVLLCIVSFSFDVSIRQLLAIKYLLNLVILLTVYFSVGVAEILQFYILLYNIICIKILFGLSFHDDELCITV